MLAKYGVEVRDFRYAFVLPRSGSMRDDRYATGGGANPTHPAQTALSSEKSPKYIEVKLRPDR